MDVVELLKRHEGFSRTPYRCTAGKVTIGFGRNLESQGISEAEAEWLLERDVDRAIGSLRTEPYWLDLSDVRQAVLIDMVFNLGWAGFAKFARLRMALGRQDWDAASNEMRSSLWFKQVGTRSQRLCVMMQTGLWPQP
jgi:lysozyme